MRWVLGRWREPVREGRVQVVVYVEVVLLTRGWQHPLCRPWLDVMFVPLPIHFHSFFKSILVNEALRPVGCMPQLRDCPEAAGLGEVVSRRGDLVIVKPPTGWGCTENRIRR